MQHLTRGQEVWACVRGAWRRCRVLYPPGSSSPTHCISADEVIVSPIDPVQDEPWSSWPARANAVAFWPGSEEDLERIERLFREYCPGDRVRAALDIFYGDGGEVSEGDLGTVERTRYARVRGVALVHWDRLGQSKATSCDSLDPAAPQDRQDTPP
jgi:hypothetical protein